MTLCQIRHMVQESLPVAAGVVFYPFLDLFLVRDMILDRFLPLLNGLFLVLVQFTAIGQYFLRLGVLGKGFKALALS